MDILANTIKQKQLEYVAYHNEIITKQKQYQREHTFGYTQDKPLNTFLSLTTTFHNIPLWSVTSLPIQCVIAAKRILKVLQLWNAYCKYVKQQSSASSSLYSNNTNTATTRTVTFEHDLTNANTTSNSSNSSSNKGKKGRPTTSSSGGTAGDTNKQESFLKPITTHQTTIIYHASLTLQYLIGSYEQGKWMDGLLLRKLRLLQSQPSHLLENTAMNSNKITSFWNEYTTMTPLQLIVLTGPITYHIESLLHGMYFQSTIMGLNHSFPVVNTCLTFPTGEYITLPSNVKIIIETADLQHASPSCLSILPIQTISYPLEATYQRIL